MQIYFSKRGLIEGLCMMICIRILIPDAARAIFLPLSLNSFCTLILASFWILHLLSSRNLYDKNFFSQYIIIFFVLNIIISLLFGNVPVFYQLSCLNQFFLTQLLPTILTISIIKTSKDIKKVTEVYAISFAICMGYGLFCFISKIGYYYNQYFIDYFGYGRNADMTREIGQSMGGIVGRIVGTPSADSYSFGMIVPFACLTLFAIQSTCKNRFNCFVFWSLFLGVLCTTRRSPIIALFTFFFFLFLFSNHKLKYIKYVITFVGVVFGCVYLIPELESFKYILETVLFFWDDNVAATNNVSGSSVGYRTYQLMYTLEQIKDSWLFGNGWGSHFFQGRHPNMNGWESIVFTTLMQFGLLGVIMWSLLFWLAYRYSAFNIKLKSVAIAYIIAAVVFCILTDTIYHYFIFLGSIIIYKLKYLNEFNQYVAKSSNINRCTSL